MSVFKKIFPFIILGIFFVIPTAHALEVQPVRYTSVIDPGDSQLFTVTVKNDQTSEQIIHLSVQSAGQDAQGRTVVGVGDDAAVAWTSISNPTFNLKPGKSREVVYTIFVPTNTPAQSHSLAFVVSSQKAKGAGAISTQAGVLVSLTVGGEVRETLSIERWLPANTDNVQTTRDFNLVLKNAGTVDVPLQGKISVYDWRHTLISEESVRLGNRLPNSSVRELRLPVTVPVRSFFGWYSAKIIVQFGAQKQFVTATKTVWYGAYWIIIIGTAVLVGSGAGLYVQRQRKKMYANR